MTEEDRVAEKLKGKNCLVKFRDGEEMYLELDPTEGLDSEDEWFIAIDHFLNADGELPILSVGLSRDAIKYIIKI